MQKDKIIIRKDGEGYLATISGYTYLYARGMTKKEATEELGNVIDMMVDYHQEQVSVEKKLKKQFFIPTPLAHAI